MKDMNFTKKVKIMLACFVWGVLGDLQKHRECNCQKCALPSAAVEARFCGRKIICVLPKHAEPLGRQQKHQIYQTLLSFLNLFPLGTRSPTPKLPDILSFLTLFLLAPFARMRR